jgi:murein DD-endopeptidase MepM/ murein hydrolase activator NlpD
VKILILTNARRPYHEIEIDFQFCVKVCVVCLLILVFGYLIFTSSIFENTEEREHSASSRLIEDQFDAKYLELQLRLEAVTSRLATLSHHGDGADPLLPKVVRLALEQREENQLAGALISLNKTLDNDAIQFEIDNTLRQVRFDSMLRQINDIEYQVSQAGGLTTAIQIEIPAIPLGMPLANDFKVSRSYGYNLDPFTRGLSLHEGMDLAAAKNTNILATADGIVSEARDVSGYGLMVEIKHSNGFITRYGHASKLLVQKGQEIKKGDVIALVGSTGRSTGNHLHYEILFGGQSIDPQKLAQMK